MRADPDGTLVRTQDWPEVQTSRIGKRFVSITQQNGEPNLLPIPRDLAPWIAALRSVVIGKPLPSDSTVEIAEPGPPWVVALKVPGPAGDLTLTGCGATLWSIEMTSPDQVRRVLTFDPPA